MRDAEITILYKNKLQQQQLHRHFSFECYCEGLWQVVLSRIQPLAERLYSVSQYGLRRKTSTTDMIFSLRQIQEGREQRRLLHISFVDLTRAFYMVSGEELYIILQTISCSPRLLSLVRSLHDNMEARISFELGAPSSPLELKYGVKQGCVLASNISGIVFLAFSAILHYAFHDDDKNVMLRFFCLQTMQTLVRGLLFADDVSSVSHSETRLQSLVDRFAAACVSFSPVNSSKNTAQNRESCCYPRSTQFESMVQLTHTLYFPPKATFPRLAYYALYFTAPKPVQHTWNKNKTWHFSQAMLPQYLRHHVEGQDQTWDHCATHRLTLLVISKQGACAKLVTFVVFLSVVY